MEPSMLLVIAVFGTVVAFFVITSVRAWRTYRGVHVIQCPETRKAAAVRVDTGHAALTALTQDAADVQLASCSRWPERAGCDQACVPQIERDPKETRLDAILADIFTDQHCALCRKPIAGVPAIGHKPALRAPDGRTIPCDQIAPEHIEEMLDTHRIVCWDCDVAERFRREFPDRVIDVPGPPPC